MVFYTPRNSKQGAVIVMQIWFEYISQAILAKSIVKLSLPLFAFKLILRGKVKLNFSDVISIF